MQQRLGVNAAMTHCCLWHPALAGQVQLAGMLEHRVHGSKPAMHARTLTTSVVIEQG